MLKDLAVKAAAAHGEPPARLVRYYAPVGDRRSTLQPEELEAIHHGRSRWLPRIIQTDATPVSDMMASPAKQSLLGGLAAGSFGAGLGGMAGSMAGGHGPLGALVGAAALGLPYAAKRWIDQDRNDDVLEESIRRLPADATKRDLDMSGLLGNAISQYYKYGGDLSGLAKAAAQSVKSVSVRGHKRKLPRKQKQAAAKDPSYDPRHADECCPSCGARQERGDDGSCNRCGKPWPLKTAASTHRHEHTDSSGTYDMSALFPKLESRPAVLLPLSDVKGANRSRRTGFSPVTRLPRADTRYPVLVDSQHNLLDGRHRVLKLQDQGQTHVRARYVTPEDMQSVKIAARTCECGTVMRGAWCPKCRKFDWSRQAEHAIDAAVTAYMKKHKPIDSVAYVRADKKEVHLSIGDAEGDYDLHAKALKRKLPAGVLVSTSDEGGRPEGFDRKIGTFGTAKDMDREWGGYPGKKAADMTDSAQRAKVPKSKFALPGKAPRGQSLKKSHGSYPMPDSSHARAALGFAAMHHGKNSVTYRAVAAKAKSLGYMAARTKTAEVTNVFLKLAGLASLAEEAFEDAAPGLMKGLENEAAPVVERGIANAAGSAVGKGGGGLTTKVFGKGLGDVANTAEQAGKTEAANLGATAAKTAPGVAPHIPAPEPNPGQAAAAAAPVEPAAAAAATPVEPAAPGAEASSSPANSWSNWRRAAVGGVNLPQRAQGAFLGAAGGWFNPSYNSNDPNKSFYQNYIAPTPGRFAQSVGMGLLGASGSAGRQAVMGYGVGDTTDQLTLGITGFDPHSRYLTGAVGLARATAVGEGSPFSAAAEKFVGGLPGGGVARDFATGLTQAGEKAVPGAVNSLANRAGRLAGVKVPPMLGTAAGVTTAVGSGLGAARMYKQDVGDLAHQQAAAGATDVVAGQGYFRLSQQVQQDQQLLQAVQKGEPQAVQQLATRGFGGPDGLERFTSQLSNSQQQLSQILHTGLAAQAARAGGADVIDGFFGKGFSAAHDAAQVSQQLAADMQSSDPKVAQQALAYAQSNGMGMNPQTKQFDPKLAITQVTQQSQAAQQQVTHAVIAATAKLTGVNVDATKSTSDQLASIASSPQVKTQMVNFLKSLCNKSNIAYDHVVAVIGGVLKGGGGGDLSLGGMGPIIAKIGGIAQSFFKSMGMDVSHLGGIGAVIAMLGGLGMLGGIVTGHWGVAAAGGAALAGGLLGGRVMDSLGGAAAAAQPQVQTPRIQPPGPTPATPEDEGQIARDRFQQQQSQSPLPLGASQVQGSLPAGTG